MKKSLDEIFAEIGFPEPPKMISKKVLPKEESRRREIKVGPCGKHTFPSREKAREVITRRLNFGTGGASHLIAYHCKHCGGWHLSSRDGDKPSR